MIYHSSKHGPLEIADMPLPHVKNALAKLKRKSYRTAPEYEMIGALKQSILERERNPSTSALKDQLASFQTELEEVKQFHSELKAVVSKY